MEIFAKVCSELFGGKTLRPAVCLTAKLPAFIGDYTSLGTAYMQADNIRKVFPKIRREPPTLSKIILISDKADIVLRVNKTLKSMHNASRQFCQFRVGAVIQN